MTDQRLDFLVIGAQKCATSWMYYCLREHPELKLPVRKREVEYLGGDLYRQRGSQWYFSLFHGARAFQKIGDVSVEYLYDPRSPDVVRRYAPDVKLVVSLRDPIDRAVSAYFWSLRTARIPYRGIEDGLRLALAEYRGGRGEGIYCDLLRRGFYAEQLERYLTHFRPEQIAVLLYEEIQADPPEAMARIYSFLGVDASFRPSHIGARPKRTTYLGPMIRLERIAPTYRAAAKTTDTINQLLFRLNIGGRPPDLSGPLLEEMTELFWPQVRRCREILLEIPECTDLWTAWNPRWRQ